MEKTLLVRLSSMGDLIHTLPAINDLAYACPQLKLAWLCEEAFADIARLHPFVKEVVPMALRRWRKNWWQKKTINEYQILKRSLKQAEFDCVLDAQGLLKSAYFAHLAQAPIWGLDQESARESLAARFYQKTFSVPKGQMAVERNRQLFAAAFGYTQPETVTFGAKIPANVHLDFVIKPYVVFLHATSRNSKLWSESNWRILSDLVHQQLGVAIYLPWGSEAERQRALRLAAGLDFMHICPKLSLLQAASLLQNAQAVVGVDTGLLHLANAFNVPLIGIYTDTHPDLTGVIESDCAKNLGTASVIPTVDEVWNALNLLLVTHG